MTLPVLADWARTHPYPAAVLAAAAAVVLGRAARRASRPPAAVLVAAFAAVICTAYSADTSWYFAADHFDMSSTSERATLFAAAEVALFASGLMARQNLNDPAKGAPGAPGVIVWLIVGVQVIPAYSESGIVAGTVRAVFGPIMAGVMWHLVLGIELRHRTGTDSQALPAVLTRELRERLLSWLGLSVRGRDAAQITRDRWTRIAAVRAARLSDLDAASARPWRLRRARRRLADAVDHTDAGVLPEQRAVLLDRIAAYQHAAGLATVTLPSPWQTLAQDSTVAVEVDRVPAPAPVPEVQAAAYPQLPAAVPKVVPAGVHLLPLMARPTPAPAPAVLASAAPRTRPEVRAEYVPQTAAQPADVDPVEPEDDSPPPPAEDTLTARARADFLSDLIDGALPTYRALKERYGIGQQRATRIRAELEKGLPE